MRTLYLVGEREGGLEKSEEAGWEGLEVFCGCSVPLRSHRAEQKNGCLEYSRVIFTEGPTFLGSYL